MKKKSLLIGLLLPLFIVSCSTPNSSFTSGSSNGGGTDTTPTTPVAVTSVSLDRTSMTIFDDDEDAILTATIYPEDATNKEIIWTSANTGVATVNDGKINPLAKGTTTITATTVDGNKVASCSVTVNNAITIPNYVLHGAFHGQSNWTDKPMVNNSYKTDEYMILGVQLYEGDVFKIHMVGNAWYGYTNIKTNASIPLGYYGLVDQAASDDNIYVNETGIYDIYCTYNYDYIGCGHIYLDRTDDDDPYQENVSVKRIELNRTGKYLKGREEFNLTANVLPNNATNKNVTWTSSDTSIATVTTAGRVIANKDGNKGSTTITARTEDGHYTATCLVYVTNQAVPDYYLVGTITGYTRSSYSSFPAIPISSKKYLISDVQLMVGDVIYVKDNYGGKLKVNTQTYVYNVTSNETVNITLDVSKTSNYLTFEARNS